MPGRQRARSNNRWVIGRGACNGNLDKGTNVQVPQGEITSIDGFSGLFLLQRHRDGGIGGQSDLGAFHAGDEAELDIVMVSRVQPTAIALLELDAIADDVIDGTDMYAISADDLHPVLDLVLRHGALLVEGLLAYDAVRRRGDDTACHQRPSGVRVHTDSNSSVDAVSGFLPLKVRPTLVAEIFTCEPSRTSPARIISASGSCTLRWITRFKGRAP